MIGGDTFVRSLQWAAENRSASKPLLQGQGLTNKNGCFPVDVFESPRRTAARIQRLKLRRNPASGRTQAQYKRITRALTAIADCINDQFDLHGFKVQHGWLPTEHVISVDDSTMQGVRANLIASKYQLQARYPGYLVSFHDPGRKASNRIEVASVYTSARNEYLFLQKGIHCPLPCERWGRLPITLAQWAILADSAIVQHLFWQWLPALHLALSDDSWQLHKVCGWYLTDTAFASSYAAMKASTTGHLIDMRSSEEQLKDEHGWIGHNIYRHITSGFSLDRDTK